MNDEQHRHECECRYWLKVTKGHKPEVDDLMLRLEKKRGKAAADRVRDGMQEEWSRQNDC